MATLASLLRLQHRLPISLLRNHWTFVVTTSCPRSSSRASSQLLLQHLGLGSGSALHRHQQKACHACHVLFLGMFEMACKSFFPACVVWWCMRGDLNESGGEVLAVCDGLELQWRCGLGMTSLSSFIRHNFHVLWSGWVWEISREFVELLWFVWLCYGKCLAIENCMYLYVLCCVVVMFVQLLIWSCSVVGVWSAWVHECMLIWRFSLSTLKHFCKIWVLFFWLLVLSNASTSKNFEMVVTIVE